VVFEKQQEGNVNVGKVGNDWVWCFRIWQTRFWNCRSFEMLHITKTDIELYVLFRGVSLRCWYVCLCCFASFDKHVLDISNLCVLLKYWNRMLYLFTPTVWRCLEIVNIAHTPQPTNIGICWLCAYATFKYVVDFDLVLRKRRFGTFQHLGMFRYWKLVL